MNQDALKLTEIALRLRTAGLDESEVQRIGHLFARVFVLRSSLEQALGEVDAALEPYKALSTLKLEVQH